MPLKQWVNLSKNDVFKDGTIDTVDRCGKVSVEITADKIDKALGYTLKVIPLDDNVPYTAEEEKRNPNFQMTKSKIGVIDTQTLRIDDIQLPAAGGNKYRIEVTDANGNVVTADTEIETWRRLYYQVIGMEDQNGNSVPGSALDFMERHAEKYFIELKKAAADAKMPYLKTIKLSGPDFNLEQLLSSIENAYTLDQKLKPLGMVALFSEYIAEMKKDGTAIIVSIGTPNPLCTWNTTEVVVECENDLWFGLDDADDKAKKWFISGYVQYTDLKSGDQNTDATDGSSNQRYLITRDNIEVTGAKRYDHGGYHKVKIIIDEELRRLLTHERGELEFFLDVNIVPKNGWTNGFSWEPYRGLNLITCARRTSWTDMSATTHEYTWNHEVGHRFGMTAWGHSENGDSTLRKKLPNGPSDTLYGEDPEAYWGGHQGPHCGNGVNYDKGLKTWSGTPKCVMFGANGTRTAHSPTDYCELCAPIVRKVDLSADQD